MSYRADPEAFLVREMEEALGPDAVLSVSRPAVLSGPVPLSEAADDECYGFSPLYMLVFYPWSSM